MKLRNPKHRFDLNIKRGDKVLEVGGGHNPHYMANVVCDKFVDSNYHRSGDIKILKNQKFLQADGEKLPFEDKEFDYVICCQVLEHVPDPVSFLKEQFRVAKRGYIETPSLLGEYLFPRESHIWILHEMNGTLYLVSKDKLGFNVSLDMGELFQEYLPTHSIGFKILERTHPNLLTVRIEWDTDFDYVVEPEDKEVLQLFKGKWKSSQAELFFPKKTLMQELGDAARAFATISKSVIKSKVLKKN